MVWDGEAVVRVANGSAGPAVVELVTKFGLDVVTGGEETKLSEFPAKSFVFLFEETNLARFLHEGVVYFYRINTFKVRRLEEPKRCHIKLKTAMWLRPPSSRKAPLAHSFPLVIATLSNPTMRVTNHFSISLRNARSQNSAKS